MRCERLIKACSTSFKILGHSVQASASIGLVVADPAVTHDPIDVMRRADLALNEAKRQGRGIVRVFDESMDESIRFPAARSRAGSARRSPMASCGWSISLIVGREALEVLGFEALLRWTSPEYGVIPPGMFIPIAEESNLIHELGDWVIDEAVRTLQTWPGQYVSGQFLAAPVPPHQFRRPYRRARPAQGGQPHALPDRDHRDRDLRRCRARPPTRCSACARMGFRIALDDYGTGYSSLYNIRKFALDCLKIDRSFIDGMGKERESAAIVHSIIHLGRALGLEVVRRGGRDRGAAPGASRRRMQPSSGLLSRAPRWPRKTPSRSPSSASWGTTHRFPHSRRVTGPTADGRAPCRTARETLVGAEVARRQAGPDPDRRGADRRDRADRCCSRSSSPRASTSSSMPRSPATSSVTRAALGEYASKVEHAVRDYGDWNDSYAYMAKPSRAFEQESFSTLAMPISRSTGWRMSATTAISSSRAGSTCRARPTCRRCARRLTGAIRGIDLAHALDGRSSASFYARIDNTLAAIGVARYAAATAAECRAAMY